ncbi:MAG: hypothetical protein EXS08_03995 [Planctomycetes bacterium]|nr:hypothetical protein [Planctomycetota bacterium]
MTIARWLLLGCLGAGALASAPLAVSAQADVEALVLRLGSEDDAVRAPAIEELAKGGKKVGERLLAEFASRTASERTVTGVVEVLGKMRRTGAQLLGEQVLRPIDSGSIEPILSALRAVGICGPPAAWTAPSLVKLIERKPLKAYLQAYLEVKDTAIITLGRLGPTTPAARALLKREVEAPELGTRVSSACALWWTGSAPEDVYPVFIEALAASDMPLERAIFGLGEMGPHAKEALPKLASLNERVQPQTRITIDEARRKIEGFLAPNGPRPVETGK